MVKFFPRKRWITIEEAVKRYEPYDIIGFGITSINPKDIIGLSLPIDQIKNDDKMFKLRCSVMKNGWTDEYPSDLDLLRLPSKKYTVYSGGNHRAVLSNELEIPVIKARVKILLPHNMIPEEVKSKVEYFRLKDSICVDEMIKIKHQQDKLENLTKPEYKDLEKLSDYYYDKSKHFDNKETEVLFSLARQLNYIPGDKLKN